MRLIAALVGLVLWVGTAHGATWRVYPDGSGDAPTIQAALAAAVAGDTVEVACGTYREWQLAMKTGVVLTSATGSPDCVTIDAGGRGRVLWCNQVGAPAVIRGLTVTGGRATFGGGVYLGSASVPSIEDCVFTGNVADVGGGIYVHHSDPVVSRCVFSGNTATSWGGGIACEDYAYPAFRDCVVAGNEAVSRGGGAWFYLESDASFERTSITGNAAGAGGGALHGFGCSPSFARCTIAGNTAPVGGAVILWGSHAAFERSILWGNCGGAAPVLRADGGSSASFACCDVDTSSAWRDGAGAVAWLDGNLASDPRFCDPVSCASAPEAGGDHGLQEGSPALAGAPGCGPLGDPNADACAASAIVVWSWGRIKTMWRGEAAP